MRAYTELLVRTCHARGAHAMGGMSAVIPSRKDEEANRRAFEAVRTDKEREAGDGFDGTWVAHPDSVPVATEAFDAVLGERPNQVERTRDDVDVEAHDLLAVPETPGAVTEAGLRSNVNVGIQYISSWLRGNGAAAIYGLMEDAATAEISRGQVWQWIRHGVSLDDGRPITPTLVRELEADELEKIRAEIGDDDWFYSRAAPTCRASSSSRSRSATSSWSSSRSRRTSGWRTRSRRARLAGYSAGDVAGERRDHCPPLRELPGQAGTADESGDRGVLRSSG